MTRTPQHPLERVVPRKAFDESAMRKAVNEVLSTAYYRLGRERTVALIQECTAHPTMCDRMLSELTPNEKRLAVAYYGLYGQKATSHQIRESFGLNRAGRQIVIGQLRRRLFVWLSQYDPAWRGNLRVPIAAITSSQRLQEGLKKAGIMTVADLLAKTVDQVLALDEISAADLNVIDKALATHGLWLTSTVT